MKIGILQTGRRPEQLAETHDDYDVLFKNLLAGRGFTFETFPVLDGIFPKTSDQADGWIITGSRFGVYEPHIWIPPLEDLIRDIYDLGSPMMGICFGHQIIAQALGGRVEKYDGGWSVGPTDYATKSGSILRLNAWHQDQVIEMPADAFCLAGNAFCEFGALAYGDHVLTFQGHPEFDANFMAALFSARRDALPASFAEGVETRLQSDAPADNIADIFEHFLRRDAPPSALL